MRRHQSLRLRTGLRAYCPESRRTTGNFRPCAPGSRRTNAATRLKSPLRIRSSASTISGAILTRATGRISPLHRPSTWPFSSARKGNWRKPGPNSLIWNTRWKGSAYCWKPINCVLKSSTAMPLTGSLAAISPRRIRSRCSWRSFTMREASEGKTAVRQPCPQPLQGANTIGTGLKGTIFWPLLPG